MTATRIISEADIIPNRASGYELVKGEIKNQQWVSPTLNTTADGALYTNLEDLAKWDAALYTEKLLKKSSLAQMWTPVALKNGKTYPYGFGWGVDQINGHRLIEHGGAWQGFTISISRYVDDKLTIVVLTNLDSGHADPEKIAHTIAALYIPAVKPVELKPIAESEPQVTALLRATLADLAAGHADLDSFAPDARANWVPDKITGASEFLKSLGALHSLDLLERKEGAASRLYKYRATYASRTMLVNLTLDKNGKINALQITRE